MMKKYYLWIGVMTLMLGITVYAQNMSIYVNDKCIELDVLPEIKKETMYVPINFISKALGAQIKWEEPKIIITKGTDQIICIVGDKVAYKNGNRIKLTHAPYISNNRTFVPLKSISKLLACKVDYKKQDNTIHIETNKMLTVEERMRELKVMNYCVAGDSVYYVTLGDKEGFHKMLLNGTQDTYICDFAKVDYPISGSTTVTAQIKDNCILYKFQELPQYNEKGTLEIYPVVKCYELDLSYNVLKAVNE